MKPKSRQLLALACVSAMVSSLEATADICHWDGNAVGKLEVLVHDGGAFIDTNGFNVTTPIAFFDDVKAEIPSAASGFDSWITGTFIGGPVPGGEQGPNDDPDNNGIDNSLEFVLNGDPTTSEPDYLPTLDASSANFVFTFDRRDDSLRTETTQTFQYGSDLTGWTDVIVPAASAIVSAATITITNSTPADTVQISVPKSGASMLFGRPKVSK